MLSNPNIARMYTPEQIAEALQLSKNTVYELISRGEIIAKKIGRVYRIPASSVSYLFTGLDFDLYSREQEDLKVLPQIKKALKKARETLK